MVSKQSTFRLGMVTVLTVLTGLVIWFAHQSVSIPIPDRLQDTITLSLGVMYEAFPFVILGVLLSVCIQLYMSSEWLLKHLPKRDWLRRPVLSVLGVFLPVCECGNVPLARGLMVKGLHGGEVLTFLLAAPILNPVTILTTAQAFGADSVVVYARVVSAFLIANLVGWLFRHKKTKTMLTDNFNAYCDTHDHDEKQKHTIGLFSRTFAQELMRLLPALLAGSIVAGLIQTTIPRELLTSLAEQPVLSILAMIALAFIVSICANVDAFFALSLSGIFSTGAIVSFLVFGPMIDIKMLALLKTTFRTWVLVRVTTIVFLTSLLTGLVVIYAF